MADELTLDRMDARETDDALSGATASASLGGLFSLAAGALCLTACMGASLLLALAELETVELPGCGMASDCSRTTASRWGKLPRTEWPLSFVGFAYFQSLAAAAIYSGNRLPKMLRAIMLLGGAMSLLLMAVMLHGAARVNPISFGKSGTRATAGMPLTVAARNS